MSTDPTIELARQTLKRLTTRRLPPTPENYARVYAEVSGRTAADFTDPQPLATLLIKTLEDSVSKDLLGQVRVNRVRQLVHDQDWERIPALLLQHLNQSIEQQIAGQHWGELVQDLIRHWDLRQPGLTTAMKRESLERVIINHGQVPSALYNKLTKLIQNWGTPTANPSGTLTNNQLSAGLLFDSVTPTNDLPHNPAPASVYAPLSPLDDMVGRWRHILDDTLRFGVAPWLASYPDLADGVAEQLGALPHIQTEREMELFARQLKKCWIKTDLQLLHDGRIVQGIASLLRLLLQNLRELSGQDQSLIGQITAIENILAAEPLNVRDIYAVEASLKDVIYKQGAIKHSLDQATASLREMVNSFISRLGVMSDNTSQYHEKMAGYSTQVQAADSVEALSEVIDTLMSDTRTVQLSIASSRDELVTAREEVDAATRRIHELERALDEASIQVKEDQLTGAYNRRGLNDIFAREMNRAERSGEPLGLVLLDVDNFKRLNDHYGHLTGDQVLKHLVDTIAGFLRPSDSVARLGGEEFVLLLPATSAEDSASLTERLQRQLTRAYFLANQDKIIITFSAGVTVWLPGEPEADTIERADQAMYRAKLAGKNRVLVAELP